nr:hypothetical protein [Tanacetum cinerariifolium]
GGISMERRSETREHYELKQSVSMLEDQIRGLMLKDKEEKERLKKKLRYVNKKRSKWSKLSIMWSIRFTSSLEWRFYHARMTVM